MESPARDVELVLQVTPDGATALARHSRVRVQGVGRATNRQVRCLYFDTPTLDLARAGLDLRVERVGRGYVQTVGSRSEGPAGLAPRVQVESRVRNESPDLDRVPDPALRSALERECRGTELVPVIETMVRRTRRPLNVAGAPLVLDVDVGEIHTRQGGLPVSEVRLCSPSPAAVYALALEMQNHFDLRPGAADPASRGFAALTGERPTPRKAARIRLATNATLEDALQAVLRGCLEQIQDNEEPARDGIDPEGVHQMRVGVRRMRSALALFSAVLPKGAYADLSDELRWLGAELGEARDLDVFLTETLEPLAARVPGEPALKRFVNEVGEMRVDAYRRVRTALDSQRYARLMLTLSSHVASRSWRNQPLSEQGALLFEPAQAAGRKLLAKRHRNAVRLGRNLSQRTPAELHRLRIELKKLRYACEFLGGAYPSRGARRYIKRVSRLQDVLGHLNDVVNVGDHLSAIFDRMGPEVGPEHREAAGFVAGWTARDSEVRLGRLQKRWKSFRKTLRFWKRS